MKYWIKKLELTLWKNKFPWKNHNKESLISKSGERISEEKTWEAEALPVQITNKNNNKSDIEKTIDQPPAKETLSPYEELALLATNKEISNTFF